MKEGKEEREKRIPECCRIQTRCGVLEGHLEGRLYCFRGIPYARAARFQPPREYKWEGVYRAERFGLSALQPACRQPGEREKYGEDCLNLNLYVPADAFAAGEKLPVAVWLHGGAFQTGSGRDRDGKDMIRNHAFLFVSVEYRLGVLGYLYLREALGEEYRHTGNNGTLDQLAALKWIHENIEAFGGDPDRVTVFGESAGAKSLGALFLRPEMKTYCAQTLMASGSWQSIRSERTAVCIARRFLYEGKKQGYLQKPSDVLAMDADLLLSLQERLTDNPGNTCMFGPVADGTVVPYDWQERIERGDYWSGKAMVGSCLHEMYFSGLQEDFLKKAPEIARCLFGDNARIAEADFAAFEKACSDQGTFPAENQKIDEWVRILSDDMYRTYTRRLAERLTENGSPVWYYSFEYGTASHVLDQAMAFGRAAADDSQFPGLERGERENMAEILYEAFARFFETGDPGKPAGVDWKPLCEDRSIFAFSRHPVLRPLTERETLDDFPQSVFRLEE